MAVHPNGTGTADELVGVVEAVNERGVKIAGAWRNVSKWAESVILPERGATVTLSLDKSGFIRTIAPANGEAQNFAPPLVGPSKDTTITRLAVLKAAAEFAAGRPDVKSGDVLRIAESWEAWVTRD